jgi:hypothetical protein
VYGAPHRRRSGSGIIGAVSATQTRVNPRSLLDWLIVVAVLLAALLQGLDLLGSFADPNRVALFEALRDGSSMPPTAPKVPELLEHLGVPSPSTVVEVSRPAEGTWENVLAEVIAVRADGEAEKLATIDEVRAWAMDEEASWPKVAAFVLTTAATVAGLLTKALPCLHAASPPEAG